MQMQQLKIAMHDIKDADWVAEKAEISLKFNESKCINFVFTSVHAMSVLFFVILQHLCDAAFD